MEPELELEELCTKLESYKIGVSGYAKNAHKAARALRVLSAKVSRMKELENELVRTIKEKDRISNELYACKQGEKK